MFTQRKIFSSSLAISAARVELTGMTLDDNLRVERLRRAAAGRIHAADDFGNLRQAKLFVAGVFALRRERQEKIARDIFVFGAGGDGAAQAAFFQDGQHQFFGCAGIGGGFQNDELTLLQMGLDGNCGLFDVAEIGFAAFVQRRGHADQDSVRFFEAREISGGAESAWLLTYCWILVCWMCSI